MTHGRGLKLILIPKSDEAENDSFEIIAPKRIIQLRGNSKLGT
jgi:hypothetical protein